MADPAPAREAESGAPTDVARGAFVFIFITVLLDMLALGLVTPVLPRLVESFTHDTAQAARYLGLFATAWALMQFLFSPLIGMMSDRFGRRPVVLVSNFGLGLNYVLMALAPSLAFLFVARVISGITAASISTAYAYVADVTAVEKRAARFGQIGAAFGAGFVLGPALGGFLGGIDLRLPFWTAAALSLINGLYGLLILPESLSKTRRAIFSWKRANPVGGFRLLRSHPELTGLATVSFFSLLGQAALPNIFVLYAGYRYQWNEAQIGLTLALIGVGAIVVQGFLTSRVVRALGERRTLLAGLGFGIVSFALFAFASAGWVFLLGVPFLSLWGLSGAAAQGMMTRRVGVDEQGQLQGANTSVQSIAALMGPVLFTQIFAYFISPAAFVAFAGAPMALGGLLLIVAAVIAARVTAMERARSA